jgi:hypothetical protein
MRLRAEIAIEVEAADYLDAAKHQETLTHLMSTVRDRYPEASMSIRERRQRRGVRAGGPHGGQIKHYTGRLNSYAD